MRISLKIHTFALWKFFLIVFIALFLLIILLSNNSKVNLILGLSFLVLSLIGFFAIGKKYLIFHKYDGVKNQTKKVFELLSLNYTKNKMNYLYVKKINLYVKIHNLGIASMISFVTDKESKETKYLETTILKYQYSL